jgi:acyl-CoA thioester hydrolase
MRAYDDGQYPAAEAALRKALSLSARLRHPRDRATAHKLLAFMQCTSDRMAGCEADFRAARSADPAFALSARRGRAPVVGAGVPASCPCRCARGSGSSDNPVASGRDAHNPARPCTRHVPRLRATPPLSALRAVTALRVYWEDTDAGGVVFYANYLKFFERARTEWLRAAGRVAAAAARADRRDVRRRRHARALPRPARLDDLLEVTVAVAEGGAASLRSCSSRPGAAATLLAEGRSASAASTPRRFRPRRIPESAAQALARPL